MYYEGRDNGGGSSLKFGAEFWTDGRSVAKRLRALAGAGACAGRVSPHPQSVKYFAIVMLMIMSILEDRICIVYGRV